MAGDWIKMRGALLDHPKVIALARVLHDDRDFREWLTPGGGSELNGQSVSDSALRCVTTALLMKVWSVSREHGKFVDKDLVLTHSAIADLDQIAGAPGIGKAMEAVGWAIKKGGVTLPNFIEFNVPMTAAEKQAEYRKRQKPVTGALPERSNKKPRSVTTRVEKSREEGKPSTSLRSVDSNQGALIQTPKDQTTTHADRTTGESSPVWHAYSQAYSNRYGVEPVRNAKVNGQLVQLVKRLGAEEAPRVAEFFVGHNAPFYVKARHPVDMLLRDAEGMRTQWATGIKATSLEARSAEQVDSVRAQIDRVGRDLEKTNETA